MFERDQRITVPDPDNPGARIAATFFQVASDHPATVDDPRVEGGTRRVDQAWVRYDAGMREGTSGLVPCSEIEPAE